VKITALPNRKPGILNNYIRMYNIMFLVLQLKKKSSCKIWFLWSLQ